MEFANSGRFVQRILLLLILNCAVNGAFSQACPVNIDFETGNFTGWTCYTGFVSAGTGTNVISLTPSGGPVTGRHTMLSANPGDGVDEYGGFPVNCPNGSGHSIKLGNNQGGGEAEGISYEFTIPANQNVYNIIYNYAVVFQDPNHLVYQQPRMQIEVTNVTDNKVIDCSSFAFFPFGSPLPGFFESSNPGSPTPVYYKNWTAVSINLDGHAGKTIRLFFKTADCTFRRHFGYAYIDVNSECSGTFVGAAFCPDDSTVHVTAPYGYQGYTWFNSNFTQVIGNQQVLTLTPPPARGTTVAVQLVPYNGYGCLDTLFAQLLDTLTVVANAGKDTVICNGNAVPIGSPPKPGLVYSWSPVTGLTNARIANPYANPTVNTTYVLTVNHDGGGCLSSDTVIVKSSVVDTAMQLAGRPDFCIGSGDSAVLSVNPADSIQWYRDNIAIPGAISNVYKVLQTGSYHAVLFSGRGCNLSTRIQLINISTVPVAAFNLNNPNQCLAGNIFNFRSASTNAVGAIQYQWVLGDGAISSVANPSHVFSTAGIYNVSLLVRSNPVCADSIKTRVTIFANAVADFTLKPVCIALPMQAVNNTIDTGTSVATAVNYTWTLPNGQVSHLRTPPSQVFANAGTYGITLSVNTNQCPLPLNTLKKNVLVDKPKAGLNNPVQYAVLNLPSVIRARSVGDSIFWTPGIFLNNRQIYRPTFNGSADQLYTIQFKTVSGCITIDTQFVKTVKEVKIYVPTAFTPDNDGKNDYLRPLLMGIGQVQYFRVFNRWGQLLFEAQNDLPGWDGTFKGTKQLTQSVVWTCEGIGVDGKTYNAKGTSMLIR